MQTHLTEHLIGQCFHEGLNSDRSRNLMVHLDRGCYACQKVMRVAAGEKARYSQADAHWADPVILALWRWPCVLRGDPH